MARARRTTKRGRNRDREPEAPDTVVFEDDHQATSFAIILAGLVDPGTELADVDATLEVADALFNAWLERFEEPEDRAEREREDADPDDDD